MTQTTTLLVHLPGEPVTVGSLELHQLIREALHHEGKLTKRANLEEERTRYGMLCERIEYIAQSLPLSIGTTEELSEEYLQILTQMDEYVNGWSPSLRLGATFYPMGQLLGHAGDFEELAARLGYSDKPDVAKRIRFFKKVASQGGVVVEIQDPFHLGPSMLGEESEEDFRRLPVSDRITRVRSREDTDITREQVALAVEARRRGIAGHVNFSNTRNDLIPKVLHEFVYGRAGNEPIEIDVVYSDGSEARPFPLFCLTTLPEEKIAKIAELPEVRVGLLSARHSELESLVTFYWFRNQEISQTRAMAETDQIAYEKSIELLRKLKKERGYRIGLYHTGFPPAVVGFYRALVEELVKDPGARPWIEVTPYFFLAGKYSQGNPWR